MSDIKLTGEGNDGDIVKGFYVDEERTIPLRIGDMIIAGRGIYYTPSEIIEAEQTEVTGHE